MKQDDLIAVKSEQGRNISTGGETEKIEERQEQWFRLYQDENDIDLRKRWEYEEVVANPAPFFEEIKKLKVQPAYKYVLRYIEIRTGVPGASRDAVAAALDVLFRENGYSASVDWTSFLDGLTDGFDYEKLKFLALGMHMPLNDFETFLRKVLKKAAVNFYDRDQVLVYLTLKYSDSLDQGRYFESYEKLRNLYPELTGEKMRQLLDIYPPEEDSRTEEVGELFRQIVEMDDQELFEEVNEDLSGLFERTACRQYRIEKRQSPRSSEKKFFQMWNDWGTKLSTWDFEEMKEEEREARDQEKMQESKQNLAALTVRFPAKTEVEVPEGMLFSCRLAGAEGEGCRTAEFRTIKREFLRGEEKKIVKVKVKALMAEEEFRQALEGGLKKKLGRGNTQFVKQAFLGDIPIRIKDMKDVKGGEAMEIRVGSKVRFADSPGKSNNGTFEISCKEGTWIPRGTHFTFELEGCSFEYESLEDAFCLYSRKVAVMPLRKYGDGMKAKSGRKAGSGLGKSAAPGRDLEMETDDKELSGHIFKITAGKRGKLYLFQEKKCGKWGDNSIEVLYDKDAVIPRGTRFLYTDEKTGEKYSFESLEDTELIPAEEKNITAKWINADEFISTENEKKSQGIPAGTEFACGLKNICEVYTEKKIEPAEAKESKKDRNREENSRENTEGGRSFSDSLALRYLYRSKKGHEGSAAYYKGFPEYGPGFFLNTKTFKDTRITRNTLSSFVTDEERKRNLLLTMAFLQFLTDGGDAYMDGVYGENANMIVADFEEYADGILVECGFYPFYRRGYPYDAFLALLLNCNDPFALFQDIWSEDEPLRKTTGRRG